MLGSGTARQGGGLTVHGAAPFRRRVHLVGVWGTAGLQPRFRLLFLFLIVDAATAYMGEKGEGGRQR